MFIKSHYAKGLYSLAGIIFVIGVYLCGFTISVLIKPYLYTELNDVWYYTVGALYIGVSVLFICVCFIGVCMIFELLCCSKSEEKLPLLNSELQRGSAERVAKLPI